MLPNLIVVGATGSGTTSLHHYLNSHPQIAMSNPKELHFFVQERNWNNGLEWYSSHFIAETKIKGESSPCYTSYPQFTGVAKRMYSTVPHAKLIYILRDPLERMISHYIHYYSIGYEDRDILEALTEPRNNVYLNRSRYYMQLEQYLEYYAASRILILTQEELSRRRSETLQKVFRFVEVDETLCRSGFSERRNKSADKRRRNRMGLLVSQTPGIGLFDRLPAHLKRHVERVAYWLLWDKIERPIWDEKVRQKLVDSLRDDIERLRAHTGISFDGWSV
jgi:hypothetical protein